MKEKNPKIIKTKDTQITERTSNALFFPWSPIDGVDMIAGEKFTSSKDIGLTSDNDKERTHN